MTDMNYLSKNSYLLLAMSTIFFTHLKTLH